MELSSLIMDKLDVVSGWYSIGPCYCETKSLL